MLHLWFYNFIYLFKKKDGPDTFSKTGKIFGEFANKITDLVFAKKLKLISFYFKN